MTQFYRIGPCHKLFHSAMLLPIKILEIHTDIQGVLFNWTPPQITSSEEKKQSPQSLFFFRVKKKTESPKLKNSNFCQSWKKKSPVSSLPGVPSCSFLPSPTLKCQVLGPVQLGRKEQPVPCTLCFALYLSPV